MNKETYEALRKIIRLLETETNNNKKIRHYIGEEIKQVKDWIDEVAEKYEDVDKNTTNVV